MGRNRHSRAKPGTDTASRVAFDSRAPEAERLEARTELQKSAMAGMAGQFIPPAEIMPVIEYIQNGLQEQSMQKALGRASIIPHPSTAVRERRQGMQSVRLDDLQVNALGHWYDRPGAFSFEAMRNMVDQTPILAAIVGTRTRQVERFCRQSHDKEAPGFNIVLKDPEASPGEAEKESAKLLAGFFTNCGWATRPRERMRLRRDDFTSFMKKLTRNTLTMDSMPIETEWKRDKSLGLDGMYAVDGSTIRLCTEIGYEGDDEVYAVQVVQGRITACYTWEDLIYIPRNPRADVLVGGYGHSETELLVRTVTGFLNAFNYNNNYFDKNSIPKGMLHLYGNYDERDIHAFKRMWNNMVKGVDNSWALPVMVSKDQESGAKFESIGAEMNEAAFTKWMQLLGSIACAIYSIAPEEINFESFSAGASSLSGDDTQEKLTHSNDKGLVPLLSYYENLFTDFVVAEFDDKFCFRFTGLEREDGARIFERQKLVMTANEMRATMNLDKRTEAWADAPLNPALQAAWQMENQPEQDFGDPSQSGGQPGEPDGPVGGDFGGKKDDEGDFGESAAPGQVPPVEEGQEDMSKAMGLPIYTVEA